MTESLQTDRCGQFRASCHLKERYPETPSFARAALSPATFANHLSPADVL